MINRNVLTQVNQDSGSLTFATTVAHKFTEGGQYKGLLYRRGNAVAQFAMSVGGKGGPDGSAESATLPSKVDVDLTSLEMPNAVSAPADDCGCCGEEESGDYAVAEGGYAVFRVPAGAAGGYAVELYKAAETGRGEKVFDSRALDKDDILAVVLLRPGTYSVANVRGSAKAELKVAYPEKIPKLLEPVKISCAGDKIRPEEIKVYPTQGIVFSFEGPSQIKIDLVKPDDRPRGNTARSSAEVPPGHTGAKKHSRRLQLMSRHRTGVR